LSPQEKKKNLAEGDQQTASPPVGGKEANRFGAKGHLRDKGERVGSKGGE